MALNPNDQLYRSTGGEPVTPQELAEYLAANQTIPAAGATALGGVFQAPAQSSSTATDVEDLVSDFNELLGRLRASGILAGS